jgi:predicted TIM-barrel fold metal-dependent hydrolase
MIIDVHHHYLPQRYFDEIESLLPPEIEARRQEGLIAFVDRNDGYTYLRLNPRAWSDAQAQIVAMDAAGIDHALLSSSCFQDWMTIEAARVINDGTAAVVAEYPGRFSGMISVPPDGGSQMVEEIRRAHTELGLCAINISATHKDRYPDHDDFRLLLRTAAELELPVFVHPSFRGPVRESMGQWSLERTLGKAMDMNLAVARLLYSGALAHLPALTMVFGHLGGSFPLTRRRLFFSPPGVVAAPDFDYATLLKRVYFDTAPSVWQSPAEIECAVEILGGDQLMLGSDYPLSNDQAQVLRLSVDHVRAASVSEEHKEAILSRTAVKVFKLGHLCGPSSGCCPGDPDEGAAQRVLRSPNGNG